MNHSHRQPNQECGGVRSAMINLLYLVESLTLSVDHDSHGIVVVYVVCGATFQNLVNHSHHRPNKQIPQ